jgi:maltooligosyltrehalose trehalohydrolase
VKSGRLEFLTQFPGLATQAMRKLLPRPGDEVIFHGCKLSDEERSADSAAVRLHRDLLRLRREDQVLARLGTSEVRIESAAPTTAILLIRYISEHGHRLLVVNRGNDHLSPMNDALFAPAPGTYWSVQWSSDRPDYGGGGIVPFVGPGRWLIRGHAAMLLMSVTHSAPPAKPA